MIFNTFRIGPITGTFDLHLTNLEKIGFKTMLFIQLRRFDYGTTKNPPEIHSSPESRYRSRYPRVQDNLGRLGEAPNHKQPFYKWSRRLTDGINASLRKLDQLRRYRLKPCYIITHQVFKALSATVCIIPRSKIPLTGLHQRSLDGPTLLYKL